MGSETEKSKFNFLKEDLNKYKEEYGFDKDKYDETLIGLISFKIICEQNKFNIKEI